MLTQAAVVPYLVRRRLLDPAAIVDGDLVIRDASSRNRNFRVEATIGPSYVLKQGIGPEGDATVAREAEIYGRLLQVGGGFSASLPAFHGYDSAERVLILGLVPNAQDLRSRHIQDGQFPPGIAAGLGSVLGALHRLTRNATVATGPLHGLPWALLFHRPDLNIFRDTSSASLDLIRIVQQTSGFPEKLDELRDSWRPEALIHNDVKWDNVLVSADQHVEGSVKLIDWEASMLGDPCWDAGSVLGNYLSWWLFSIPVTGAVPPRRFPELATSPLDSMKPAMNAFWVAYADSLGLQEPSRAEWLMRVVRFAAARLLQTAYEACQMMVSLTGNIVLHLQLSSNILNRTEEAAGRLLGLPVVRQRP